MKGRGGQSQPAWLVGKWVIPAAVAGALLAAGVGWSYGVTTTQGYVYVPPCVRGMDGSYEWRSGPLDDEGASMVHGELHRGGWEILGSVEGYHGFSWVAECKRGYEA